jgi:8-oxo-dGTP pyrophosphatase MutT (NUDIX family)
VYIKEWRELMFLRLSQLTKELDLIMHHVSVAGVVPSEDGKILLIKRRDNGEWQIPGGLLEKPEFILFC